MAQLHTLQKQVERYAQMLANGIGCKPCVERSLENALKQIEALRAKENKDG